jgi:transcriptional regulator with GAF, ATPase, and Fis domain
MHAEVVRQRGAYTIIDCGSKNGVLVNGKLSKERVLLRNDEVRIGNTVFLFNSDLNIRNARFSDNSVYMYPAGDETHGLDPKSTLHLENLKAQDREGVEFILRLADSFGQPPMALPETAERIARQAMDLLRGDFAVLMLRDRAHFIDQKLAPTDSTGSQRLTGGDNDTQEDISSVAKLAEMHERTQFEEQLDLVPLVALPHHVPVVINHGLVKTVARDQVALLSSERAWRPKEQIKDVIRCPDAGVNSPEVTVVGNSPQSVEDSEAVSNTPGGSWRVDTSNKNPVAVGSSNSKSDEIVVPAHVTGFNTPDRSVSTLCAPIIADGETLGVLLVERAEANAYSLRDLGLLQAAAKLSAGLLQTAELTERLETLKLDPSVGENQEQFLPSRNDRVIEIFEAARRASDSDVTILITGESGTGKEVLARHIHRSSRRCKGPFIAVNCAAIPPALFESEIFGHEKGAFTGADRTVQGKVEAAHGGTLLLDEVGELELALQPKLLRFLQDKAFYRVGGNRAIEVDVRVVAATNQDLSALVREGRFREDLYYRLNVVPFHLPPLRERREDIAQIVDVLIARHSKRLGRRIIGANDAAITLLQKYDWPGNIREMENAVERAIILAQAKILTAGDFGHIDEARRRVKEMGDLERKRETRPLEEVERMHILAALKRFNYNQARAAEALGVHRNTLRNKIIEYGIDIQKESRIQGV